MTSHPSFSLNASTCLWPPLVTFWMMLTLWWVLCVFVSSICTSVIIIVLNVIYVWRGSLLCFVLCLWDVFATRRIRASKAFSNVLLVWCEFANWWLALTKCHHNPPVDVNCLSTPHSRCLHPCAFDTNVYLFSEALALYTMKQDKYFEAS